jgi:hypothetical protein
MSRYENCQKQFELIFEATGMGVPKFVTTSGQSFHQIEFVYVWVKSLGCQRQAPFWRVTHMMDLLDDFLGMAPNKMGMLMGKSP